MPISSDGRFTGIIGDILSTSISNSELTIKGPAASGSSESTTIYTGTEQNVSYVNPLPVDRRPFVATFGFRRFEERTLAELRDDLDGNYQVAPIVRTALTLEGDFRGEARNTYKRPPETPALRRRRPVLLGLCWTAVPT